MLYHRFRLLFPKVIYIDYPGFSFRFAEGQWEDTINKNWKGSAGSNHITFSLSFSEIHELNALNILVHGVNSCVVVLEIIITSHPFHCVHGLYGAAAGMCYGVFSAVYWAAGGTDRVGKPAIYSALDWRKPGTLTEI